MVRANHGSIFIAALALTAASSTIASVSADQASTQRYYNYMGTINLNGQMWHPLQLCVANPEDLDKIRIDYKAHPDSSSMEHFFVMNPVCQNLVMADGCPAFVVKEYGWEGDGPYESFALRCCSAESKYEDDCNLYEQTGDLDVWDNWREYSPTETSGDRLDFISICVTDGDVLAGADWNEGGGPWQGACEMNGDAPQGCKWFDPRDGVTVITETCPDGTNCQDITRQCPDRRNYACRWKSSGICSDSPCTKTGWPLNTAGECESPDEECVEDCAPNL